MATRVIPETPTTALVISSDSRSFIGHPEIVRKISISAVLPEIFTLFTMPSSVSGLRSSGSMTVASAPLMASILMAVAGPVERSSCRAVVHRPTLAASAFG